MPAAAKRQLRPDPLLKDIASFDARFRAALGDRRRVDRVRGFGGPDNPYDDFAPKLERLFGRARKAFDQRNMRLARDAYAALFATLALKDDYGFAITRPKSISICDEQVHYLRALGETASPGYRGVELTEGMHRTYSEWLSSLVPKLRNQFFHGAYLLSPDYLFLAFQMREIADALNTRETMANHPKIA
jgi:hypothetical protein